MEPVHSLYDSCLGLKSPGRNTFGHDYEGISRKDRKTSMSVAPSNIWQWYRDLGAKQYVYTCLPSASWVGVSIHAIELFCDIRLLSLPSNVDQGLQGTSRLSALSEHFWDVPLLELSSYWVPCISRVHTATIVPSLYCIDKSSKHTSIINIYIQFIGSVPLESLV